MEFKIVKDAPKSVKFFHLASNIEHWVTKRQALLEWFTSTSRPIFYNTGNEDISQADLVEVIGTPRELKQLSKFLTVILVNGDMSVGSWMKDTYYVTCGAEHKARFKKHGATVFGIIASEDDKQVMLAKLTNDLDTPPFSAGDRFILSSAIAKNYEGPDVVTDVGKYFFNWLLLINPFEEKGTYPIPYINDRLDAGKLDDIMAQLITDHVIGRTEFNKYMANGYAVCEDGSIFTGGLSEKALTVSPEVQKRKEELFAKYKDSLDDPTIMVNIEKELIELDKASFKGDPAEPFLMMDAGGSFGEQRKKFFITFGTVNSFKKTGGTEFMKNNLGEGWGVEDVAIGANEIRRGAYGRGKETAKGGEQTKFILRILQNVRITEEDCHSNKGLPVTLRDTNYKEFIGRYEVKDTKHPLTEDYLKSKIGQTITIRGPMYCKTPDGYCQKCCGSKLAKMGIEAIGMQSIAITSAQVSISMKAMHQSSVKNFRIKNFHKFLRA